MQRPVYLDAKSCDDFEDLGEELGNFYTRTRDHSKFLLHSLLLAVLAGRGAGSVVRLFRHKATGLDVALKEVDTYVLCHLSCEAIS